MMQKTSRGKSPMLGSPKCSVCGDLAVHVLKRGAIVLCDKHYQQRFGRWSGSSEGQAYNFAYNEGHSDSRKDEGYNPIKTKTELVPFRRVLNQKGAESTTSDRPVWGAKTMNNINLGRYTGGGHYLLVDASHVMMLFSDGAESAGFPARIPDIGFDGPTATKTVREMKAALKEADALIHFKNATYSTDYIKQAIMKLPINTEVTLQNGITPNYPLKMTFDFKGKTYHTILAPRVDPDNRDIFEPSQPIGSIGVTLDAESFSAEKVVSWICDECGNDYHTEDEAEECRCKTADWTYKQDLLDGNPAPAGRTGWSDIVCSNCGDFESVETQIIPEKCPSCNYWMNAESFSAEPSANPTPRMEEHQGDFLLPIGTKVRSYDFWPNASSYIEGVIEKIAPSPRCSPDCMHYHIRTTKTVRNGEETNEDAIGEIFMTHPYEDFGWELRLAKHIQVMDAESFSAEKCANCDNLRKELEITRKAIDDDKYDAFIKELHEAKLCDWACGLCDDDANNDLCEPRSPTNPHRKGYVKKESFSAESKFIRPYDRKGKIDFRRDNKGRYRRKLSIPLKKK